MKYGNEMRLFDPNFGERLYVDAKERDQFLNAANEIENRKHRLFCHVLHWTGARISEVLELTGKKIDFEKQAIIFRTIKKRKLTRAGEIKKPVFRQVPVPDHLTNSLDLLFDLKNRRRSNDSKLSLPLWSHQRDPKKPMSRSTGWPSESNTRISCTGWPNCQNQVSNCHASVKPRGSELVKATSGILPI